MKFLTVLLIFVSQLSFSQSSSLDKVIQQISLEKDTILSVYNWITDNISYDVGKLEDLTDRRKKTHKKNSKSEAEHKRALLENVIKRKKGVCEDYSLLFDAIVTELGYNSYIVEGITKKTNGRVNKQIGHTWNAVKVSGEWKLYDPTWGAGYNNEKNKFVKKYNAEWYEISSEEMSKTHLPYDPVWQLSDNPISYSEFEQGSQPIEVVNMDYNAEINNYLSKGEKDQILDRLERSKSNGESISLLKKWQKYQQSKADLYDIISQPDLIENSVSNCEEASNTYNEYIKKGRSKNFKSKKWNVDYSKSQLLEAKTKVESSLSAFEKINVKDRRSRSSFSKFKKQAEKLLSLIGSELNFLEEQNQ